jgi:hypothetical protein
VTDVSAHVAAIGAQYDSAVANITLCADAARRAAEADLAAVHEMLTNDRPPLIAGIPVDEPPPYVPPPLPAAANALIPDTPLLETPAAASSLAFDDAPLWQS